VYYHTATFEGSVPFPLDMLRYDQCWPRSSSDAQTIACFPNYRKETRLFSTPIRVEVARYSASKRDPGWCTLRWKSFGWKKVE